MRRATFSSIADDPVASRTISPERTRNGQRAAAVDAVVAGVVGAATAALVDDAATADAAVADGVGGDAVVVAAERRSRRPA